MMKRVTNGHPDKVQQVPAAANANSWSLGYGQVAHNVLDRLGTYDAGETARLT